MDAVEGVMRGTVGLLALVWVVGCDTADDTAVEPDRVETILALTGDAANGETVWDAQCNTCHDGLEAVFGDLTADTIAEAVVDSPDGMPDFSGLPDQDIADIVAYLESQAP